MLLFILHRLWSIIDDSGSVVSSIVSLHPALLSFHMLAGNLDRAPLQRERLVADLGVQWEASKNTFKPYPCGIVMHAVIDAWALSPGTVFLQKSG